MKVLVLILSLFFFSFTPPSWAELKPFAFPFLGKWQSAENPLLIDDYGLQDIQNMRRDGKRLKGIKGHDKINPTAISSPRQYPKNAFQFVKDYPYSESHILALMEKSTTGSSPWIYQNISDIPDDGDFSGTTLWEDVSGAGMGQFSSAPGGMVYANEKEVLFWGGDESYPLLFITSRSAVTEDFIFPLDYSEQVRNKLDTSDEVVVIGGGNDDPYTKLLLHFDGVDGSTTYTDSNSGSTTTHTFSIDVSGVSLSQNQKKFGTASGAFGAGTSIYTADSVDWVIGSGNTEYTVDFWVMYNKDIDCKGSGGGSEVGYFGQGITGSIRSVMYKSNSCGAGGNNIYFNISSGGTWASLSYIVSNRAYTKPYQWYHMALIKGWGNDLSMWAMTIDGNLVDTWDGADLGIPGIPAVFTIGSAQISSGTTYYLPGWIDEFRISKGMARWTSEFDPPSRSYRVPSRFGVLGVPWKISGVSWYVDEANGKSGNTVTWKEWNGASWSSVSSLGVSEDPTLGLSKSGRQTWSSTEDTSQAKYLYDNLLYFYQWELSGGEATVSNITVDIPLQKVSDIWDGEPLIPASFKINRSGNWEDYTDEILVGSTKEVPIGATLSSLTASDYIIVTFAERLTALRIIMASGNTIFVTSGTSLFYWGGSGYIVSSNLYDTTIVETEPLNSNGTISWQAPKKSEEFPQEGFYQYKIVINGTMQGAIIDTIKGVPAQEDIKGYDFSIEHQNRLLLFKGNQVRYSATNTSYIWNGNDSGIFYIGGEETEIQAAVVLYNVFRTSGFDQLIAVSKNKTFRVTGAGPGWVVQEILDVGITAPLSMQSVQAVDIGGGILRHAVIWQAPHGIVMTDGATILTISDDINSYWDSGHTNYITPEWADDSYAWYDSSIDSYKILVASGSGATNLNTELEYSLRYREWTKINRGEPIQVGFPVRDIRGNEYTYGIDNTGFMHRLESGTSFAGTSIFQVAHTKDLFLDNEQPMFRHTTVRYTRTLVEKKGVTSGETIFATHYGDGVKTVSGVSNQKIYGNIDPNSDYKETWDTLLGPFLKHSFKYESTTSTVEDGMELLGLGLLYDRTKRIME